MSELIVEIVTVDDVVVHPNADRLDLAIIKGWQCVVTRGAFKPGDKAVYIPIDSVLLPETESKIFGPDSKVKLSNSRVKTIKLRGAISQGLLVAPELLDLQHLKVGTDIKNMLGITKYEPPARGQGNLTGGKQATKKQVNPNFRKYTDLQNIKNYPKAFEVGEMVSVTEKVHGCFRGDTLITLVDGSKLPIKKIVDNKLKIEVLSMDANGQLVASKVTHWFNNGPTNEWLNVKIKRTGTNKGSHYSSNFNTTSHQYFIPKENQYKEASLLVPGDKVVQSYKKEHLTDHQKEILIGKILGDGTLSGSAVSFGHKKEHEDYVDYTLSMLGNIAGNKQKTKISGFNTPMITARTRSIPTIKEFFSGWIKNGIKEVPNDVYLSPITLAFWYMDDGSLSHTEKQQDRACFATCGFSETSVKNLTKALSDTYGLSPVKFLTENKHWRIRLNKDDADKFFHIVSPYVCECMRYKLPEKYRNLKTDTVCLSNKTNTTLEKSNQEILSIELINIEKIRSKKMSINKYDIGTECHNFFANDFLVHNSNWRASYVEFHANTVWKKVKKFLGLVPKYEFVYGSHNVQLQDKDDTNIYAEMVKKYDIKAKLKPGEVVYGEVYGSGIQKNYTYGCAEGERRLAVFDVAIDGKYLSQDDMFSYCAIRNLPSVIEVYRGPFDLGNIRTLLTGDSKMVASQKTIEGGVCRPLQETAGYMGRKVLKFINDEYLLKDNTEFH